MPKREITTEAAPTPSGSYSQAIRAGDLIFVAGQVPRHPHTGQMVGQTIEEQTERVLDSIKAILEAAGATMADVVKATVHLSDMDHFDGFNRVYAGYFPDPKPVRTTTGSQLKGFMVEIDVVAYVGDK